MQESQLEKHIKNKVDGHISPIDADALWSDIQKKRRKPGYNWWMLGALGILMVLLTISAAFYLTDNQSTNRKDELTAHNMSAEKNTSTSNSSTTITNSIHQPSIQLIEKENEHSVKNEQKHLAKIPKNDEIKKGKDIDDNLISINRRVQTKQSFSDQSSDTKPTNKEKTKLVPVSISNKTSATKNLNAISINKEINKKQSSSNKSSKKIDADGRLTKDNNIDKTVIRSNLITSYQSKTPPNNSEVISLNKQDENLLIKELINNQPKTIDFLNSRTHFLLNDQHQLSILQTTPTQMVFPGKKKLLELGFYSTYEYAFRQFKNSNDTTIFINDSLVQSYINARKNSESFVESFRVGLSVRKPFKYGIRLSSGIEYAQLTERFDAQFYLGRFMIVDDLDSAKYKIVEKTSVKRIYNRYKTVNVPLLFGKTFKQQYWYYWFDVGVAFNVQFDYKGQIFEDWNKENIIDFSMRAPSIFKDRLSISYLANLGMGYHFDNGFIVEFGPHFQSTFKSINQHYNLDTKYYFLGAKLNLMKSF